MRDEQPIKSWRVVQPMQIKNTLLVAESIRAILDRNGIIPEDVAQLGCGSGALLITLEKVLKEADRLTGYESHRLASNASKAFATERLRFLQRDITRLGDHAWYDLLLVINVLERMDDYELFLDRIRVKGRNTLFLIPLVPKSGERVIPAKNPPIHYFEESKILSDIEDSGFGIIDKMYLHLGPNNWRISDNFAHRVKLMVKSVLPKYARRHFQHSMLLLAKNGQGPIRKIISENWPPKA